MAGAAIGSGLGRPLDRSVRRFLESRFGEDLGHIRVHAGPQAARGAAALGARAFAVGRDIGFAAGRYRPETEAGMRLLAHEVAHVCQQRRGSNAPGTRPGRVGRADDPLEREAELVAARILSDEPLPAMSPDPGGVIRRVLEFDRPTAGIDFIDAQAIPRMEPIIVQPDPMTDFFNMTPSQRMVALHLSKGFNPDPNRTLFAIDYLAHVKLKSGTEDDFQGWTIGFVQLIRLGMLSLVYQGRKPDEGHIFIDAGPAVGQEFMLDLLRTAPKRPFYDKPGGSLADGEVTVSSGDHPTLKVVDRLHNETTTLDNFLMRAEETLHAITIFAAKPPGGAFQFLAHVQWFLTYSMRFKWVGSDIKVEDFSILRADPGEQGSPKDNNDVKVGKILGNLGPGTSPVFNDRLKAGIKRAFEPNGAHRFDRHGGHRSAPADFFE